MKDLINYLDILISIFDEIKYPNQNIRFIHFAVVQNFDSQNLKFVCVYVIYILLPRLILR